MQSHVLAWLREIVAGGGVGWKSETFRSVSACSNLIARRLLTIATSAATAATATAPASAAISTRRALTELRVSRFRACQLNGRLDCGNSF